VINKKKKKEKEKFIQTTKEQGRKKKVGWSLFIRIVDLEHKNKQLLIITSKSKTKY
jgi:hypothetical protein